MTFAIFCTSIDRVWCSITTTIDFTDNQRLTTVLIDVDRDRALDITALVITTKHATELTAGHGQCDITFNDGFLSTAINGIYELIWQTVQGDVYIALHVSMATSTIDFTDIEVRTAVASNDLTLLLRADICAATDITLGVTTTIDIVDITTKKLGHSLTCTIVGRCLTVFIDTNVCTRIAVT